MNSLLDSWRERAAMLERYGAHDQAAAVEACIEDAERWEAERQMEVLTIQQAALESGYAVSTLRNKIRAGELINVGGPRSPRVTRSSLRFLRDGARLTVMDGGERAAR